MNVGYKITNGTLQADMAVRNGRDSRHCGLPKCVGRSIGRWWGKRWADLHIRAVALAPSSYSRGLLTYVFAEPTDDSIMAQWWLVRECERKFGASKVRPSLILMKRRLDKLCRRLNIMKQCAPNLSFYQKRERKEFSVVNPIIG